MLSWSASKNGHYSDASITAASESITDIGQNTYNDAPVKASKIAVFNYASGNVVEVYLDSEPVIIVQAYTNQIIDCAGNTKLRIINRGLRKLNVRFVDTAYYNANKSSFSASPVQYSRSGNALLLHFNDSLELNDGAIDDVSIQVNTGASLVNTPVKFGGGALANNASGGLIIGKNGFVDLAKDFTLDAWFWIDLSDAGWIGGTNRPAFQVGYDLPAGQGIIMHVQKQGAALAQLVLLLNGVSYTSGNFAFLSQQYVHLALTKNSNNVRAFYNGALKITGTSAMTNAVTTLSVSNDNNASNRLAGYVDELRFSNSASAWSTTFTPPVNPYI